MTDAFVWLTLLVSQILLHTSSSHPVTLQDGERNQLLNRLDRSVQPVCSRKTHLKDRDGIIVVNQGYGLHQLSCAWTIHVPRGTVTQLEFSTLNIEDSCPGICQCNYVAVREIIGRTRGITKRYCNERKPRRDLVFGGDKIRIHLRLKPGNEKTEISLVMKYNTVTVNMSPKFAPQEKTDKDMLTYHKEPKNHNNDISNVRVRKLVPGSQVTDVTTAAQPTQTPGPSKLTILLAVAIPVVLIFILVVLLIAYYNYYTDKKQHESGEEIPKSGTTISDLIMNSSITLTPMFNLGKARRESTQRKEKANKLYDDMLQNWRLMNADKKKRELAREESVNTWESYKKHKQRRNTKDAAEDNNNQAFAMLVSNAINVATSPSLPEETEEDVKNESKETIEEDEEKPRTNSILIKRDSADIRNSRGSKVLSWSDVSTTKPVEENVESNKRTKSETELKTLPRGSGGSAHIPAIVVSQPSVDTEDDDTEANDTDRLIKGDKDSPEKTSAEQGQTKNARTYSCSDHVKDILRESYGDEMEDWFQKPRKSASQGSLQHGTDSNIKYQAMKSEEGDEEDID